MGSLDIGSALPNSTKCDTWRKAEASHTTTKIVQLKLEDIYGFLILLLTGLIIGTMIFFLELVKSCMVKCHSRRKGALGMQMYIFGSSRVHELSSCRVTSSFSSSRVVELFLGFVPFPVPSSRFPVKYGATLFRPKSHGSLTGVGLIICGQVKKA